MIGASKILTVSYGTFSCTLEGFDEPFNTMKAIAEYFRDLAAEDRYFGAEPPTPDAAMLHKIAEREIQRRVEAKINENGVILRAEESPAPRREIAAPVAEAAAAPAEPRAATPEPAPAEPPAPVAPVMSESVAAKLMRIRAAVAQVRDVPEAETVSAPVAAPLAGFGAALASADYVEDEATDPVADTAAASFAADPAPAAADTVADPVLVEPEPEATVAAAIHTALTGQAESGQDLHAAQPPALADDNGAPEALASDTGACLEPATETAAQQAASVAEAVGGAVAETGAIAEDWALVVTDASDLPASAAPTALAEDDDAAMIAGLLADDAIPETGFAPAAPLMTEADPVQAMAAQDDLPQQTAADAVTPVSPADDQPEGLAEVPAEFLAEVPAEPQAVAEPVPDATTEPVAEPVLEHDAEPAAVAEQGWGFEAAPALDAEAAPEAVADTADLPEISGSWEFEPADAPQTQDFAASFDIPDEDDLLDDGLMTAATRDDDTLRATLDALLIPEALLPTEALSPTEAPAAAETAVAPLSDLPAAETTLADTQEDPVADIAAEAPAQTEAAPVTTDSGTPDAAIAAVMTAEAAPAAAAISEKAQRARARVIRIRRADPALETPAPAPAAPSPAPVAATLSAEAEADLMRELAELQSETPAATAPRADTARPDTAARRQVATATGAESVSRLIEQTNSEMHEPENRRRLSALAHLKAAVAATVADRLSGGSTGPSEAARMTPYRSDLARVVRPSRPADGERPAPLVLVSEQRIDRPKPPPVNYTPAFDRSAFQTPTTQAIAAQPAMATSTGAYVRPRRVTAAGNLAMETAVLEDEDEEDDGENLFGDAKDFAEFAERLGAHGLPDIMEAAAAYTACIEGRPHFSRPQLMRHVAALAPEGEYTREAGLRSFGTLMRTGRIEKVKRGQFALTESSHFLLEARKLAR